MENNFECKFYEEKTIGNQVYFKCQNVKHGVEACKQKDEFCGYFEECECCKNQDTDRCSVCYLSVAVESLEDEYE